MLSGDAALVAQAMGEGRAAQRARDALVAQSWGAIRGMARALARKVEGIDAEDLANEGVIGLLHALPKWDPAQGSSFRSYALPVAEDYMRRAITWQSRTIRISKWGVQDARRVQKAADELRKAGQAVSAEALAELTGMSVRAVREVWTFGRADVGLSEPAVCGGMTAYETLGDLTPDPDAAAGLEGEVERAEAERLTLALFERRLSEREADVLAAAFGIGCEPEAPAAVGERHGVGRYMVRKVEVDALRRLIA